MENTAEFILRENVLTDNLLILPLKGFKFKYGYIAIVKEYSFANEWSDKESIRKFKSEKQLFKYLDKKYPNFDGDFYGTCLQN